MGFIIHLDTNLQNKIIILSLHLKSLKRSGPSPKQGYLNLTQIYLHSCSSAFSPSHCFKYSCPLPQIPHSCFSALPQPSFTSSPQSVDINTSITAPSQNWNSWKMWLKFRENRIYRNSMGKLKLWSITLPESTDTYLYRCPEWSYLFWTFCHVTGAHWPPKPKSFQPVHLPSSFVCPSQLPSSS